MKNYQFKYTTKDGILSIKYSGDLTLTNIDEIYKDLKKIRQNKAITIDLTGAKAIDFSFCQLLLCYKNSHQNSSFEVLWSKDSNVAELLELINFLK